MKINYIPQKTPSIAVKFYPTNNHINLLKFNKEMRIDHNPDKQLSQPQQYPQP